MDIAGLNQIGEKYSEKMLFVPGENDRHVKVFFVDDEVVIFGITTTVYVFWCSVTKADDLETNREIFAYIMKMERPHYLGDYWAKGILKYGRDRMMHCYSAMLDSADEILPQFEQARQLCRQREADPQFIQQLRSYKKKLAFVGKNPVKDYKRLRRLIEKIKEWGYLRCSENPEVRELYNTLIKMGYAKYNAYMTEIH